MPKFQKILHPTDFSETSREAADYACFLARQSDAEIHVLYVVEDALGKIPDSDIGFPPPSGCVVSKAATPRLNAVIGIDATGVSRLLLATRLGPISSQIVSYADDNEVDVIVLGTHGRSGLAHALMGSVAESVVRKARCPVLTVPAGKPTAE